MKKNDTKSGKSKCINRRDFIRNSAPLGAGLMTVSFTPMKSFLHEYDLSGKMVIPFNTHGVYCMGSSFRQVEDLCPDSNILEGFSIKGGLERDGIYLDIKGERREEFAPEYGNGCKVFRYCNNQTATQPSDGYL